MPPTENKSQEVIILDPKSKVCSSVSFPFISLVSKCSLHKNSDPRFARNFVPTITYAIGTSDVLKTVENFPTKSLSGIMVTETDSRPPT